MSKLWTPDSQIVPATRAVEITASSNVIEVTRALHINTSETITVDFADGATGVDLMVVAGQCYPYRVSKITAGTSVVALY